MKIGRYEIERELGQGGMAVVYLARDPNMKRQVAIKLLPKQLVDKESFLARFQREVEVVASLEHPRIVPIYDCGEHDGQPYIVMRYLPGGSLEDKFREGPIPLPEISAIISQVAEALDEAHNQGIVHRDIKPANVIFSDKGQAYLSDFGIAKVTENSSMLTGTNIVGTPEFMSPEQALAKDELDGRSDVYSLGVVLFYALTNKIPYRATTPIGTALAHIHDPFPSFATLNLKHVLPAKCEAVVKKAMAKDRNERYATAGEFAAAFDKVIKDETVLVTDLLNTVTTLPVTTGLRNLAVTLEWTVPVDMSLMAFYRAKDGQVGGIFFPDSANGTSGDISRFPFIQLSQNPTIKTSAGPKHERLRIIHPHQMSEVYICVVNVTDTITGQRVSFSQYDARVILLDDKGDTTTIPLNFAEVGTMAIVAKIESTDQAGTSLIPVRRVMDLTVFQTAIPGATSLQTVLLEQKLTRKASHIMRLAEIAQQILDEVDLPNHHAKVALCLDISATMAPLYEAGNIQRLIERILALGCRLDDNGTVDIFLFGKNVYNIGQVNIDNVAQMTQQILDKFAIENGSLTQHMASLGTLTLGMLKHSPLRGKVYYSKVMHELRLFYFPDGHGRARTSPVSAYLPIYAIFVTNGDTADEQMTVQQLTWAAYEPIFWQFVAIGKSHRDIKQGGVAGWFAKTFASDFTFLEKLDTMEGRYIDNANFFSMEDPETISDDELYHQLMTEYPDWVALAQKKYLLQG